MDHNEQSFTVLEVQGYINALTLAVDLFNNSNREIRQIEEVRSQINGRVTMVEKEQVTTIDPLPRMDNRRAMCILQALADETISQFTHYRMHNNPVPAIAQALRDCAVPDPLDLLLAENFLCSDIVDGVVLEFNRQLSHHISGHPWRQWQLMATPRLMALIGGKDFRIAEWERYHGGEYAEGDEFLRVNITSTANFIQHQIATGLNIPHDKVPIYDLMLDGLRRQCPELIFQNDYSLYPNMIAAMGVRNYEAFYHTYIREPIESFVMMFMHGHMDRDNWMMRGEQYNAEFTTTNQLVLTRRSRSVDLDERRYRELRQSVDAGDWLPEREIRWMEQYERLR